MLFRLSAFIAVLAATAGDLASAEICCECYRYDDPPVSDLFQFTSDSCTTCSKSLCNYHEKRPYIYARSKGRNCSAVAGGNFPFGTRNITCSGKRENKESTRVENGNNKKNKKKNKKKTKKKNAKNKATKKAKGKTNKNNNNNNNNKISVSHPWDKYHIRMGNATSSVGYSSRLAWGKYNITVGGRWVELQVQHANVDFLYVPMKAFCTLNGSCKPRSPVCTCEYDNTTLPGVVQRDE